MMKSLKELMSFYFHTDSTKVVDSGVVAYIDSTASRPNYNYHHPYTAEKPPPYKLLYNNLIKWFTKRQAQF